MASPAGFSSSSSSGGVWLKVSDVTLIGSIVKITLDTGAFTISYYSANDATATFTTAAFGSLALAQDKFDDLQKILRDAFTLVDVS